jgi:thiol-disulfide isomerase/thioredoxin
VLLLCGVVLLTGVPSFAADKKEDAAKPVDIKGELTKDDDKDSVRKESFRKVHPFKMIAGKTYIFDLKSNNFDAFLRLEDPSGKQVAEDDDSGGGLNAQIVYKAKEDGEYKVVATSFPPNQTGKYTLRMAEAGPAELLAARAKAIGRESPAERREILKELEKHFSEKKDKLTMQDGQLALQVAIALEQMDRPLAAKAYSEFAKEFSHATNPTVTKMARTLEGASRRVNLPGHKMEIKGETVDGKPVDWNAYKGKVVLVDFWATWCGPCRAELPNVKEMYDGYHDKGFDVLGISVDANKEALEKFLEKEKLPWNCIHDKQGMNGSLSEYYGIMFIPLPILVDRDGQVVSMNARGEELRQLLRKHLGPPKKSGEEKAKEKTP